MKDKWQPIENAPKDNRWILIYYSLEDFVSMATWIESNNFWWDWDGDIYQYPTHWMPLPEPPK